jgi:hypothetical protein
MSYAKIKQLCSTASAYTNNDKFIPLNSKIYDEVKIKFKPLYNSDNENNNIMPKDLKTFGPVVKQTYSEQNKLGGCIPCNKY